MNIRDIIEAYNEYQMNYCMNNQEPLDNNTNTKTIKDTTIYENLKMKGVE